MSFCSPELTQSNTEKSFVLASALFSFEEWIPHGEGIFVSKPSDRGDIRNKPNFTGKLPMYEF